MKKMIIRAVAVAIAFAFIVYSMMQKGPDYGFLDNPQTVEDIEKMIRTERVIW